MADDLGELPVAVAVEDRHAVGERVHDRQIDAGGAREAADADRHGATADADVARRREVALAVAEEHRDVVAAEHHDREVGLVVLVEVADGDSARAAADVDRRRGGRRRAHEDAEVAGVLADSRQIGARRRRSRRSPSQSGRRTIRACRERLEGAVAAAVQPGGAPPGRPNAFTSAIPSPSTSPASTVSGPAPTR